jgi:S1-C subfamily serine protease
MQQMQLLLRRAFLGLIVFSGLAIIPFSPAAGEPTPDPTPAATPPEVAATETVKPSAAVENSVVKVFSSVRYPDLYKPWSKQAPSEFTGSGVVIEGKRILTNAHVVLYASQVQVQANQSGDKLAATVEFIAPGIDLAVLKLDDESFFATHPPLAMAKILPDVKDAVMAYGYPTGGNSLSITKGIVSRIEFTPYNNPVFGLRIQIDAAINPGNSGGPAVVGDKMIGLAFSHLGGAQNIGYIIPSEEIEIFLKDMADGTYDGKPDLFDRCQTLENPALRTFLKLDKSVEGMVIHQPESTAATYPLKEWDVITKVGDTPVDNQGMIKLGPNLRVHFRYLVQRNAKNGKIALTVVRNGKEMQVQVPVTSKYPTVIPDLGTAYPSYFVYGPMVFSTATKPFVGGMMRGDKAIGLISMLAYLRSPLVTRISDKPAFEGEELVVVSSPFFPHKLAKGYGNPSAMVVKSINGKPIRNLNHLVAVLRDAKEEFIAVDFDMQSGETMVFPRAEMLSATDEILTDNGVRTQGSPDTLAIWNSKPTK